MTFKTTAKIAAAVLTASAWALGAGAASAAPKETGVWYDDTGRGAVKIELCGAKLCGKIYWLKDLVNAEGKPLIDRHNPNENQRNRPICGLQVFGGVTKMETGEWDSGWIYDPKEGKSYSVAMQLADEDTLKVTGYLVMKMMGRTLTWKRAPADLPSCSQAANAPPPSRVGAAKAAAPAAAAARAADPIDEPEVRSQPAKPAAKVAKPAPSAAKADPQAAAPAAGTKASDGAKAAAKAPSVQKALKTNDKAKTSKAAVTADEELPWAEKKPAPAKKKAPAAKSKPAAEASKSSASKQPADTTATAQKTTQAVRKPKPAAAADAPIQQLP